LAQLRACDIVAYKHFIGELMANIKKGLLTAPREYWKHLRWTKRPFWKAERKAAKTAAPGEAASHCGQTDSRLHPSTSSG
jgi:hypothetical protein